MKTKKIDLLKLSNSYTEKYNCAYHKMLCKKLIGKRVEFRGSDWTGSFKWDWFKITIKDVSNKFGGHTFPTEIDVQSEDGVWYTVHSEVNITILSNELK